MPLSLVVWGESSLNQRSDLVQCSNCAQEIPDNSSFCSFCGSGQTPRVTCSSCSRVSEGQPGFCPYCGTSLGQFQPAGTANSDSVRNIPQEALVGVGWRFAATLVDGIVLFIVGYLMAIVTGETTQGGFNLQGASAFVWFLIGIGYYIVMEAMLGATVGKMACGLKVVKTDTGSMDWNASVVRNVLRIIDGLFVYLVGAILVWTSPQRQRLGDRVAHTVVVKKSRL